MRLPVRVLVPTDFSEASGRALAWALALARAGDGSVTLLHAFEPPVYTLGAESITDPQFEARFEAGATAALLRLVKEHAGSGVPLRWLLRSGVPEEEILTAAEEEKSDLIVMATHHGARARNGLGSVAENVIRNSQRPTLVVPRER